MRVLCVVFLLFIASCEKKMTVEKYQSDVLEFYSFYKDYFAAFTKETATAQEWIDWSRKLEKREKSDSKKIEQLKTAGYDDELPELLNSLLQEAQARGRHSHREVINFKTKKENDLEEHSKLKRFYRDTHLFFAQKEQDFEISYDKFVARYELK